MQFVVTSGRYKSLQPIPSCWVFSQELRVAAAVPIISLVWSPTELLPPLWGLGFGKLIERMCTVMLCECHKEAQMYCLAHKAPVCGDCLCLPQHSACQFQVKTRAETKQEGAFPEKLLFSSSSAYCSSCLQKFSDPNDPVIRLICSHALHARCFLQLLQNSVVKVYTCPLCNSKIWPLDQNNGGFGSINKSPLEDPVNIKRHVEDASFSDRNTHMMAQLPSAEDGREKSPRRSISIDVVGDVNSPETPTAKAKLSRLLSRKTSRSDKRGQEEANDEEMAKAASKPEKQSAEPAALSTANGTTPKKESNLFAPERRERRSATFHPRKILLFFATLSSMGTIILIYFTLSMARSQETAEA